MTTLDLWSLQCSVRKGGGVAGGGIVLASLSDHAGHDNEDDGEDQLQNFEAPSSAKIV